MPKPRVGRNPGSLLVRAGVVGTERHGEAKPDSLARDGRRVLLGTQQQASGDPRQMAFVLLVLRDLIGYSSGDAVALVILHAKNTLKLTDAEAKKMTKMMMNGAGSQWPEGFM